MKRHSLRVERERRGWSQARVAEEIGTSTRTIVRWEQGAAFPQPFYRERLSALFGKSILELGLQPSIETQESFALPDPVHPLSAPSRTIAPATDAPLSRDQDHLFASLVQDPLLSTKFFVPIPTHTLVKRTRLFDLLTAGMKSTLTLLSAPAGSGKTTLLADWLGSLSPSVSSAWISLDEEDNDPMRFWLYVLTALDACQPGLFTSLIGTLRSQQVPSWPSFLAYMFNVLLTNNQPLILVLDDYHVISEQSVHSAMGYFLKHLPTHIHLFISTRVDPPWPLSRLRARGQLQEVRMHQLCGTPEEVNTFLSQVMQLNLTSSMIAELTARTEGWMAGIQLFALSLRGREDLTGILNILHGNQRDIFDYLMEEVMERQSPTVQDFLLCTSILTHLNASCCNAVVGTQGSQEILEFLDRTNLFVVPLDQQRHWYRYHHLFAQTLHSRLLQTYDDDRIRALHRRAGLWFSRHGSPRETIPHALIAQEWRLAADSIEHLPLQHLWGSQHVLFQHWIESLPADMLRSRPLLCSRYAVLLLWKTRIAECESWLDEAKKTLLAQGAEPRDTRATGEEQRQLFAEIIAVRAISAVIRGEGQEAVSLCLDASQYVVDQDLSLRVQIAIYLAEAYYLCDQSMLAIQPLQDAMHLAVASGDLALANMVIGHLMFQLSHLGRLKQAWSLVKRVSASQEPLLFASVSWSYIYQADILREWNDLSTAVDLAEQAVQRGKEWEKSIVIPHWETILAHCLFSKRDLAAMEDILQEAEQLNKQLQNPVHLGSYITVERVRLWITIGDLESANHWADSYLEKGDDEPSLIGRRLNDIALIRVLIANAKYDKALQQLDLALQQARSAQREAHIVELLVLQALIYQATHEQLSADVSLSAALHLAHSEGYVRIFVDEGFPMVTLLIRLKQHNHELEAYIDALLAAFPSAERFPK